MLDDKNDNLPKADGNLEVDSTANLESNSEEVIAEPSEIANLEEVENPIEAAEIVSTEPNLEETIVEDATETAKTVEIAESEVKEDDLGAEMSESSVIEELSNENEELSNENVSENKVESETSNTEIPSVDYESLSMEKLVAELEQLVVEEKIVAVKDAIEQVKSSFLGKYYHFIDEKKKAFYTENPDTIEDFQYNFPLKSTFDKLYGEFREKKNKHFKSLESNLKTNLETRLAIVEEIKNLISQQENIKDALKQFNDLRERWKNAGAIPKDKYNHVWNNYHFHVENFYDYLHLDREARDIDFKHNLDLKLKIIARVEELVEEVDTNKAFRELQDLHLSLIHI
jgi:hypothetical protein